MFKRLLSLVLAASFLLSLNNAYSLDKSKSIKFDGDTYYLAFSSKNPAGGYFNEYLKEGENLNNWKKLLAVYNFPNLDDPLQAAQSLANMVKMTNKDANFQIIQNKERGEVIIDFFTWTQTEPTIAEFNIFRYTKVNGKPGLIAYQFAFRNYGELTPEYQKEFTENRSKWIGLIADSKIPALLEYDYSPTEQ